MSYLGYWAEDTRNGYGTYTYINGDTYEGEWSNNLRHGQGTYTFADSGVKVSIHPLNLQEAVRATDIQFSLSL